MRMNTSLYFVNLTDEEICKILEVVSVPYLMEPLKHQPDKYLAGRKNAQSLSREAVNHIYLQFLRSKDPVLSLYLSDIVVDIIHYFKLSDGFKMLLTNDDEKKVEELKKKIKQRQCPITVDMFMRLLDRPIQNEPEEVDQKEQAPSPKEEEEAVDEQPTASKAKFFDFDTEPEVVETPEVEVVDEPDEGDPQEDLIKDLQYQIMNLQMENQALKDENRDLLFQSEDENEVEQLKHELNEVKAEKEHLKQDMMDISAQNTDLQKSLQDFDDYKKKHNQVLLELRDYKIKYISAQAEMDQLRYTIKNDSKKLKELQNKQRSVYDNESDWMMAMHDLTWYKKQWNLPGDAPLHKIWAHLNREEAKRLAHLLKNYDRLLRTERKKEIDALKEILIVKEAILILLRSDKAMEQAAKTKED